MFQYNGANIQLLDLPGIIQGAAQGNIQGSHMLENNLNFESFLEKSLKIISALKSTGKSLSGLEKSFNSTIFCRT